MIITMSRELFDYMVRECIYSDIEKVFLAVGVIEEDAIRVLDIVECRNVAKNPRIEFIAEALCIYRVFKYAENRGLDIVALIHSHPAPPNPSALDFKGMKLWNIPWIIIDSKTGHAKAWILKDRAIEIPIQIT